MTVVLVQRDHGIATLREVLPRRTVDYENVEVLIVVVVEKRGAVAVGIDDVVLRGAAREVDEIDAGLGRDVDQLDTGALGIRRRQHQRQKQGRRHEPVSGGLDCLEWWHMSQVLPGRNGHPR
jgi:hypothetical protein